MAEVFIQHSSAPSMTFSNFPGTSDCSDLVKDEGDSRPCLSNETFTFPIQEPYVPHAVAHQRRPSQVGGNICRSNFHRPKPSNLSLSTLPPFDFGFAAQDPSNKPVPSPSRSPTRLTPPTGHTSGHRRGGSEFVGGGILDGGPVLVSTSTADEGDPHISHPVSGPPTSRRGHLHRRSHAVSQSDVRSIVQPAKPVESGSAPATPSDDSSRNRRPAVPRSNSHPGKGTLTGDNAEGLPTRPLSIISSETSSSMSTVRATHSVSESFSSCVSGRESSPPAKKTNDAVNDYGIPERHYLSYSHTGRSPVRVANEQHDSVQDNEASTEISSFAQGFYHQGTTKGLDTSPQRAHTLQEDAECSEHRSESDSSPNQPSISSDLHHPSQPAAHSAHLRPKTSPETKSSRKQRSVKSWAGLLYREEKPISNRAKAAIEPPSEIQHEAISDAGFSFENINFDDDTTMIIEEPINCKQNYVHEQSEHTSQDSVDSDTSPETSLTNPMIDLDEALAPDEVDHYSKTMATKRKLHSSGETGGFVGPGMHYHRRAESAPELEPFERPRFGFPRLGSNPAMEDAIAEEDEDSNLESKRCESRGLGLEVTIVESETSADEPVRRQSGRSICKEGGRSVRRIKTPPNPFPLLDPVEIVDTEEEPRVSMITKSSDESSITPTVSPEPFTNRPVSATLDSALQTPSLTYGTTPETPSAVSSADYKKTSFDVREARIHTARSSMTDRMTLNSSRAGDFSAGSVDDVPSLTSSRSTMTSSFATHVSSSGHMSGTTARSTSLSAPVPPKSRPGSSKRASLASLSKLMGGPHNKSRLNIQESVPPDNPEKQEKKRHRISRMMRFWKSKESLSSA